MVSLASPAVGDKQTHQSPATVKHNFGSGHTILKILMFNFSNFGKNETGNLCFIVELKTYNGKSVVLVTVDYSNESSSSWVEV